MTTNCDCHDVTKKVCLDWYCQHALRDARVSGKVEMVELFQKVLDSHQKASCRCVEPNDCRACVVLEELRTITTQGIFDPDPCHEV